VNFRKDQTNLRFYVAMLTAMKLAATKHLDAAHVTNLAIEKLTDAQLLEALNEAKGAYVKLGSSYQAAKGQKLAPEASKSSIA
jgi:hypothetical protein